MYEPPPLGYAKIVCRYDVATSARRIATMIAIGTSFDSPSARLDGITAMTKRISSVAYAVDEIASDEKTASATTFEIRWCSCSELASGRPTNSRFSVSNTVGSRLRAGRWWVQRPARIGRGQRPACHLSVARPGLGRDKPATLRKPDGPRYAPGPTRVV